MSTGMRRKTWVAWVGRVSMKVSDVVRMVWEGETLSDER